ncbi:MAG: carotenoid biosynthesis protein [Anaerolineales bacterium]|nr:carotenoid biosynthesis protein [Anaerolineales bacterium]MCX7754105.1 carotenoid biosynthesis protein [Anaerolineales bacterium]MDW8278812.1 carotenoid biosynthesis protein [Anaerolineales bacterium]
MRWIYRVSHSPRIVLAPLVLWLLTMISLPIVGWVWGQDALTRGMSVGVVIQAGAVMIILYSAWGWKRTFQTVLVVALLTYLAELLGSKTGFPFGRYHYTELLQPQLLGVPLLIPLAWLMMLPPSWAIAAILLDQAREVRTNPATGAESLWFVLKFSLVSALAITAWDLFLDPQMVAWGFWVWEQPGLYFGIPLSNYFGWILTAFVVTLVVHPARLPVGLLSLVYILTWFLQTIGQGIFWGQPGPALFGFLACGLFVFLAWRSQGRKENQISE